MIFVTMGRNNMATIKKGPPDGDPFEIVLKRARD
jgi:hypothetical protein